MAVRTEQSQQVNDLLAEIAAVGTSECAVFTAIATLDESAREAFTIALDIPTYRHASIRRKLSEMSGVRIGQHAVARHRNQECSCAR